LPQLVTATLSGIVFVPSHPDATGGWPTAGARDYLGLSLSAVGVGLMFARSRLWCGISGLVPDLCRKGCPCLTFRLSIREPSRTMPRTKQASCQCPISPN